jgi:hypothetical protein
MSRIHKTSCVFPFITLAVCTIALAILATTPARADAKKTYVTGTETIVGGTDPIVIPAGDAFHVLLTQYARESTTDPRLDGDSTIVVHALWELPAMTGPVWGSYRLVNTGGEWNGYWQGTRITTPQGIVSSLVGTCVGSGGYDGLILRWNIHGLNAGPENPYLYWDGYIVEATGGPVELPMRWRGTRIETLSLATLDFEIVRETGQGTHVGRAENSGFGFLVPTSPDTGMVTGMGSLTTPDGDVLYWVVTGSADLTGEDGTDVSVFYTGGTGRFDYASGRMLGTLFAPWGPPDENGVSRASYEYTIEGGIRY